MHALATAEEYLTLVNIRTRWFQLCISTLCLTAVSSTTVLADRAKSYRPDLHRYIAIGASETVGYGLLPRSSYPWLIEFHLARTLVISAITGGNSLTTQVNVGPSDAVSVFIGPADIVLFEFQGLTVVKNLHDRIKHAQEICIIFAPLPSTIPALADSNGDLSAMKLRSEIKRAFKGETQLRYIDLFVHDRIAFQTDLLHPSEKSESLIGSALQGRFNELEKTL